MLCITNNKLVLDEYKNTLNIEYYDIPLKDILIKTRDKIHEHYKLLTHPLSGSIKPGETPYKTIFIEKGNKLDMDSVILIENCINMCNNFEIIDKSKYLNPEKSIQDFEIIDLSLAKSALSSIHW